jgi:hypothetical protein
MSYAEDIKLILQNEAIVQTFYDIENMAQIHSYILTKNIKTHEYLQNFILA